MVFEGPQPAADGLRAAVERGALHERAPDRLDDGADLRLVELLTVARARRSRDVLVHQRAAEVVGTGLQDLAGADDTALHPRRLDVGDRVPVRDAADRVHQEHLAERRAAPRLALDEDRRGHVHEGERHELGEAAGLLLQLAGAHEVAGDVHRPLDGAVHDRDVRPQADLVRGAVRDEPFLGVHLVGADDRAHLVVEDLGRGAGQRGEPRVLQLPEVVGSGMSSRRAPSVTSSAVNPCTWIAGATSFTARATST